MPITGIEPSASTSLSPPPLPHAFTHRPEPRPPLGDPRGDRRGAADGRPRRDHRQHRAAERAAGPRLQQRLAPVDRHRLRARVRLAAAPRRPRSATSSAANGRSSAACSASPSPPPSVVPPVPSSVLVAARAAQGVFGALLAPSALGAARDDVHRSRSSAARRSASSARSPAPARPSACCSAASSPRSLSWRWCLYVNLLFALPAAIVALPPAGQPGAAGTARASTSRARCSRRAACSRSSTASRTPRRTPGATRSRSSCSPPRWSCSARSSLVERRVAHPLLPLRILADRTRGGAFAGDRHRRHRDVRAVPVPDVLHAAHARLLADRDRPRLPAAVGGDHRHRPGREPAPAAEVRPAPAHGRRHAVRRGRDALR